MNPLPTADAVTASAPAHTADGSSIDVVAERERTTGSTLASHFNAAGAALPSRGVVATVVEHLRLEEAKGGYEAAAERRGDVDAVYASAAGLVGASTNEIALFDSASTGLRVMLDALRPSRGQRIVASSSTYVSHALHLMSLAREQGIDLVIAPYDDRRRVDVAALETLLSDGVPSIVTVAHVPTSSGLVEPAAQIGEVVQRYGGTYILDATQSVGHLSVDVGEIGCDVMVTTGRKFLRAPRGTGFAYVSEALCQRLLPAAPDVRGARWTSSTAWDLDASARRYETWEGAVAARLGLGTALDEAAERGIPETQAWLVDAGTRLRAALADLDGVTVADPEGARSAIVTFVIEGLASADAVVELARRGVRVVSVPATHGQWDLGDRGVPSVVRASPHIYNDAADLAALVDGVEAIATGRSR
ncbi:MULTISPECIES: aminotransferase class V-fold PLP-dependent enzyme [Microbacterium]|jgi:selenocysteine lyase/cysteine desulfurase|uniref:aminotransferase class V-fold PLP-dependent enzyme n=1 Tax=Microbacterium TaxID=33882 RepID=UPI001D176D57|nr:aminotransferase class V-fold PLP-dependent enzyme [Microbacterium testaceum]MCC4248688.1 aminotransferase class V-fold PLP-dependent enzyme [Microbacterium testaceum]